MFVRRLVAASALVFFTACSSEPFPYPPQFVTTEQVTPHALPAPPAVGSPQFEHELQTIIARQSHLTDKEKATIVAENHITPEMLIAPVLGAKYTPENYPALYTLLRHAGSDAWRISDTTEDFWNSPRPWVADERVQLIAPKITRPGYPSGHTTTNMVWAHILGSLFPEKAAALEARAMLIGSHRIDGGVHFPHDVAGGKKIAGVIYGKMKQNPQFQKELAAAKAEITSH